MMSKNKNDDKEYILLMKVWGLTMNQAYELAAKSCEKTKAIAGNKRNVVGIEKREKK